MLNDLRVAAFSCSRPASALQPIGQAFKAKLLSACVGDLLSALSDSEQSLDPVGAHSMRTAALPAQEVHSSCATARRCSTWCAAMLACCCWCPWRPLPRCAPSSSSSPVLLVSCAPSLSLSQISRGSLSRPIRAHAESACKAHSKLGHLGEQRRAMAFYEAGGVDELLQMAQQWRESSDNAVRPSSRALRFDILSQQRSLPSKGSLCGILYTLAAVLSTVVLRRVTTVSMVCCWGRGWPSAGERGRRPRWRRCIWAWRSRAKQSQAPCCISWTAALQSVALPAIGNLVSSKACP